jgi:hypothetical protein
MHAATSPSDSPSILIDDQDISAKINALRQAGAPRFDPVRFHFLEVMAQRISVPADASQQALTHKLEQALADFTHRFTQAQHEAQQAAQQAIQHHPDTAARLQQWLASGDFKGLMRFIAQLEREATDAPSPSLRGLLDHLAQHSSPPTGANKPGHPLMVADSPVLRDFKKTLSQLSVNKQLTQAFDLAPKNAGPINSHMLMLQALELMRDISPPYLHQFMSYADTLLCLEHTQPAKPTSTKKARR